MPNSFRLPTALASLFLILSTASSAQSPAGAGVFQRYDRNRDGFVTPDELPNPETLARFDLNKDGRITLEEYLRVAAAAPAPSGARPATPSPADGWLDAVMLRLDTNGDGRISREEAAGAGWFDRVDRSRDGFVSAAELRAVRDLLGGGAGLRALADAPPIAPEDLAEITRGAAALKPGDVGIGRMIADVAFTDLAGRAHTLGAVAGKRGMVIAMTSATCPVSKRYLPSLARLERELAAQGLALLLVNPFASETTDDIKAQIAPHAFAAPYVHDRTKSLTAALAARTTTEVFLLDARRTLLYRGAIDDQYGLTYNLDAPRHRYLADAVNALVAGQRPRLEATGAPGCELDLADATASTATPVTYHRDVARILQQNCASCHHDGGIAPFALTDLAEVRDRARAIRRVVSNGNMPPWFAAPPPAGASHPWANDRSLSERDRSDLLAWLASADRPLGDPADAPAARTFPREWSIGEPNLVVPLSRAYDIQATGFMPYQFDVVETRLAEDKWVAAFEVLPTSRDVVHHVIINVHEKGADARGRDEGATGYWAAYVPGNGAHTYPEGFARKLPAGARVSFQIHYTPSGKATQDRLRLGLVFAKSPPRYEVRTLPLAKRDLRIPPGAAAHVESVSRPVPFDLPVLSFMAHMHVRGKAFKYELIPADGATETLLDIPRYDFNWQLRYDLKQPKLIPRGSSLRVTAVYDNSADNPANPDPTKLVKWGPQTVDEMMIGYLEYFTPLRAGKLASN
jgi:mono/diheme cytochrome c family protein/Ca2+-binding EF-hand superfamily protein